MHIILVTALVTIMGLIVIGKMPGWPSRRKLPVVKIPHDEMDDWKNSRKAK